MKILVFAFCIALSAEFIYDFKKVNTTNGWAALGRVFFDACLIIAFAIIERGRW